MKDHRCTLVHTANARLQATNSHSRTSRPSPHTSKQYLIFYYNRQIAKILQACESTTSWIALAALCAEGSEDHTGRSLQRATVFPRSRQVRSSIHHFVIGVRMRYVSSTLRHEIQQLAVLGSGTVFSTFCFQLRPCILPYHGCGAVPMT